METRRYCSPLGRDIDTSKATKGRGWKGLKGHMALALAVSLWIATGGVAGATAPANIYILSDGSVHIKDTIKDQSCVGTMTVSADKKTLSIGGTWSSPTPTPDPSCNGYYIYAGNASIGHNTGYTLSVNGATFNNVGYLTMYGVAKGQNGSTLSDNHVVITDSKFIGDAVIYGGYGDYTKTIENNTITIAGTLDAAGKPKTSFSEGSKYIYTAGCNDYPASTYTFSNNTVNLYGAAAMESVTFNAMNWGGMAAPAHSNNELHLGGTKSGQTVNDIAISAWQGYNADGTAVTNTVNTVDYFDKIVLHKVKWDTTTPALKATNGFTNFGGGLDISGMTFEGTPAGTMTLLQGTTGNFSTLNLTYNNGTTTSTAALGDTNPTSQVVKNVVGGTSADKGVTLTYNAIHSVSIADTSKVTYSIGNTATGITLGNMTFGTPRALTAGDFDFTGVTNTNINTANLKFTNPESATGTTTLLTNATNLAVGEDIDHTQNFTKAVNGATLSATLSGNVIRTTEGQLGYEATGTALKGVNLTGWNGTASSVPAGWTSGLTANSVTAAGFTAPTIDAGTSKDILTTATDNFFSDTQITGAMKYAQQADSSDTINGVTLTGSESKGVKASDDGKALVYDRSNFNVNNVSFGSMAWGTGRTANGAGYDYTNVAVNLSGLTFNNPEDVTADTKTLLTANNTLRNIDETVHNVSYGYSPVSGVTVDGIINGSYKATGGEISYTATGNNATKLTFGNVEWKDTGALMTRPTNITFDGADVDTTQIAFTNKDSLDTDNKMTLVSDFGTRVGTINGNTFKLGKGTGEGHAYYESGDLRYVVTKGAVSEPQNENAINQGGDPVSGHVDGDVTGGVAQNDGTASDNTKEVLAGSEVTGSVIAAVSENGVATNNVAKVTDATIGGDVIAAQSTSGTVSNGNKAEVTGGSVGGSVYGGKSDSGEVNSNQVVITDANVSHDVYGGFSQSKTAEANQVEVNGGNISGDVYGGKSAEASNNNVINFNGGTAHNLIGGGCDTAAGNIVNINGGTVENIYGAKTGTSATNNKIYLGGGTVNQNVYGGYSDSGTTSGNSVTLYGTANVSTANLYGGNLEATGNVLNIGRIVDDNKVAWTGGGQSVKNISNFEALNFSVVPWSESTAAVTISNGTASDLSMTTVSAENVAFTGVDKLSVSDKMTLLDQSRANKKATKVTKESKFTVGTAGAGTGTLSLDDNSNVIYNVETFGASERTHNTVMGAEATMTALSAGNDFIGSAVEGLANSNNTGSDGLATYANMGGGSMNVDTGSHVNTHTWNAILALGHKNEKKLSTTEYGAFFEYGTGNYSTFNGDERGDGSTRYTGGGILGKWQKNDGFYVEGSLRIGSIHDDASNVLRDGAGNPYSYNTDATYWGAHIGVGKEIKLNKTDVLDLYAKYFYNHRGSASFDAGGHYDLDAVESSVLRIGTRYTVKKNENFKFYGGIAVEHEFAGRANGTVTTLGVPLAIRGADICGTSVRGEIGATFRPGEKSNVTLDLNLSGFAGKKQGFTGGLSAVFHI
ncbi:autotransporter outer membrane beta-barrel domain-containing protein [Anaerovibrio sp. RM50]|uniref:autotransporter outer membrane beta-barrel domain-containing protein n=1 Tax=Anaerovibrio sp. RM50 TaxID=1200557 RepID=UPI000486BC3E|nr:autotransporter outer membrane beta-barrel domain-containing protein [Anaerovibrio sp. RM50]